MLRRGGVQSFRRGYQLCRRRLRRDQYGELESVFDLEHPDLVVEPGSPHAVSWQRVSQNHQRGSLHAGAVQAEQGERIREILQGALFSDLELTLWDRLVIDGRVYELRDVERWPSYRMLYVQSV